MKFTTFTSRAVLAASIALASTFAAVAPAQAAAPMQHKQVPGFYRTMIGDYEVTALYDGGGGIDSSLLHGDPALIQSLLARSFQNDPKNVSATVQGYLVNTGSKLILIDTGAGGHWGGPTLGKLVQNLKASGYKPEQVDLVLLTHLHADHAGGIYKNGKRVFPNATVMMKKADADFWLSKEIAAKAPEEAKIFFTVAQDAAAPYIAAGKWKPYEGMDEVVSLIEKVIARNPLHPGALHLYIHLLEATDNVGKAEPAADRLLTLMPAAGHMVHMPAHIYQRVGRYTDAVRSNELAIAADEDYISQCQAQGLYPMGYYPHNIHFLWFAATADGRSKLAIESARKAASKVPDEALQQVPLMAIFRVVPYYALTRFGKWDEMLQEPEPPAFSPYARGIWHYARGVAFVHKGQLDQANQELAKVNELLTDKALDQPLFSPNTGHAVLSIAPEVLAGEIDAAKKNYDSAIAHLERAVRLEDSLVYTEPAEWHYPPRQALAAILLEAKRPAEAETVYWADLRKNRSNGWSLYGLMKALQAQGKTADAGLVEARFKKAWQRSDVTIADSRFGQQAATAQR